MSENTLLNSKLNPWILFQTVKHFLSWWKRLWFDILCSSQIQVNQFFLSELFLFAMRELLNTVFKYLAKVELVGCSPNFPFLHKIACQPFSSALGPHKPSWVSNGSAVVLVKLKTEFPHSFLVLVLCREVWGFKTLLNEKTEVGEKCWKSSKSNGKNFRFYWKGHLNLCT